MRMLSQGFQGLKGWCKNFDKVSTAEALISKFSQFGFYASRLWQK